PPDDSLPNFGEIIAAQARLARPLFTADSRYVLFSIEPTKSEVMKAKKDKKKPDDMPKSALGLMDLSSGQVTRIERVKSFQVPEDGSGFIAYLLEPKPDQKKPEGGSPSASAAGGNPTVREGVSSSEGSAPQKAASSSTAGGGNPTVREGATSAEVSPQQKGAPSSTAGGGNPTVREGATSAEVSPQQKGAPSSKEKKKEYGSD